MAKILVTINVDEDTCKEISGEQDLTDAIESELAMLEQSGLNVREWNYIGEDGKVIDPNDYEDDAEEEESDDEE